ncbi:hypothetical protein QM467_05680 [Rhodoblastus sp. 17X3]|uniref:hypothetical protein n=1 Tax=Rhodoblastus sp. 17X3 TaxID=3047026 RepID=UPI0024B81349|nr:hypothetical protein [Rhodoblastus sp. 17X3]MDI9847550.1 hypothetical protein [Rhodoblastus sp. 17X3]
MGATSLLSSKLAKSRLLFGYDPVLPPDLPAELEMQAKKAGVKIFVENYTIMDEETGAPAKSFFGARD